jgi:hypothetical protein
MLLQFFSIYPTQLNDSFRTIISVKQLLNFFKINPKLYPSLAEQGNEVRVVWSSIAPPTKKHHPVTRLLLARLHHLHFKEGNRRKGRRLNQNVFQESQLLLTKEIARKRKS